MDTLSKEHTLNSLGSSIVDTQQTNVTNLLSNNLNFNSSFEKSKRTYSNEKSKDQNNTLQKGRLVKNNNSNTINSNLNSLSNNTIKRNNNIKNIKEKEKETITNNYQKNKMKKKSKHLNNKFFQNIDKKINQNQKHIKINDEPKSELNNYNIQKKISKSKEKLTLNKNNNLIMDTLSKEHTLNSLGSSIVDTQQTNVTNLLSNNLNFNSSFEK
jgi:hypothetical protein